MVFKILLLFLVVSASSVKVSYEGHKVYNVMPKSNEEATFVETLKSLRGVLFWEDVVVPGTEVKVMVAPDIQVEFEDKVKEESVEAKLVIENVQTLIDEQMKPAKRVGRNQGSYSFDQYHSLDEIYAWLDDLAATYPDVVTTIVIGQSVEGRDIKGVIVDFNRETSENKLVAMFEGGIHAREWIAPSTVTWILNEFLTSNDPEIRVLADNFEWHFFPVVNPDGYSYTFTNNRMWRKNRSRANYTTCGTGSDVDNDMSNGVDLNRNFDYVWMEVGASNDSCTNTFAGPSPFSEPETRAIANYVNEIKDRGQFVYYFAIHSYTQLMLVPYSNLLESQSLEASNYADMFEIAARGAARSEQRYGTVYRVGLSVTHMYQMSGTSFDWVKKEAEVQIAYLFELRDMGDFGFLLPAEQIIPVGLEIMDALVEMDKTSIQLGYYTGSASFSATSFISMALSIALVFLLE